MNRRHGKWVASIFLQICSKQQKTFFRETVANDNYVNPILYITEIQNFKIDQNTLMTNSINQQFDLQRKSDAAEPIEVVNQIDICWRLINTSFDR